jgi:hypothetical protein
MVLKLEKWLRHAVGEKLFSKGEKLFSQGEKFFSTEKNYSPIRY